MKLDLENWRSIKLASSVIFYLIVVGIFLKGFIAGFLENY